MKTILIIEDDQPTLSFFRILLEEEGFKTLVATDGETGLALAQKHQPDLILCDVSMPRLTGHEVLAALRKASATAAIPLIFHSARDERAEIRDGMNLGADDYLTKPAGRDEVLAAIRSRLARKAENQRAILSGAEVKADFSSAKPLRDKFGLTEKEAEVLLWIAQGKSNSEIAAILGNAEQTVKLHSGRIYEKLGVENRSAASALAIESLSFLRI